MNHNPEALGMDPRWPLECVDMTYVADTPVGWALVDFFGARLVESDNRSACYFKAAELEVAVCMVH